MKIEKWSMSRIHPYDNNPRNIENAVADVSESIRQCGYISPIIVDEDGVILAGHTRYAALMALHYSECDVVVAEGLTEEQKKKYRLYDNKAGELAKWDQRKLSEELFNVDFHGYDFGQPKHSTDAKRRVCPCCGEEFEV